jgi:uncharacterized coiled-coil DUF342 family protein
LETVVFDLLGQALLGVWSLVLSWLHIAKRDEIADMKKAIEKALKRADDAHVAVADVSKALDSHRLFAAETFARRGELKEAINDVKLTLQDVAARLTESHEKLVEKLDDLRERLPPKTH